MDNKSIITQVSPDELTPSIETKDEEEEESGNDEDGEIYLPPPIKETESKITKGNFISKLLCCFGYQNSDYTDNSPSVDSKAEVQFLNNKQLFDKLLPSPLPQDVNRICLVIDLDETLVHSSFKPIPNADFVIPVELDGVIHRVYVLKRPFVDEFLVNVGNNYECVLFTASLAKYADPVTDLLDRQKVFRARLFRESCVFYRGNYVKDLGRLGRDLKKTAIIDNSPASYIFHPNNAIPITTWFDDPHDTELRDLIPFLDSMSKVNNIYSLLKTNEASTLVRKMDMPSSNNTHPLYASQN